MEFLRKSFSFGLFLLFITAIVENTTISASTAAPTAQTSAPVQCKNTTICGANATCMVNNSKDTCVCNDGFIFAENSNITCIIKSTPSASTASPTAQTSAPVQCKNTTICGANATCMVNNSKDTCVCNDGFIFAENSNITCIIKSTPSASTASPTAQTSAPVQCKNTTICGTNATCMVNNSKDTCVCNDGFIFAENSNITCIIKSTPSASTASPTAQTSAPVQCKNTTICGANATCMVNNSKDTCVCNDGFIFAENSNTTCIIKSTPSASTASPTAQTSAPVQCKNTTICGANATCMVNNSKDTCVCNDGFIFAENSNITCIIKSTPSASTASPTAQTSAPVQCKNTTICGANATCMVNNSKDTCVCNDGFIFAENSNTTCIIKSTPSASTASPTAQTSAPVQCKNTTICGANATCMVNNSKDTCVCNDGFIFAENSNITCIIKSTPSASTASPTAQTSAPVQCKNTTICGTNATCMVNNSKDTCVCNDGFIFAENSNITCIIKSTTSASTASPTAQTSAPVQCKNTTICGTNATCMVNNSKDTCVCNDGFIFAENSNITCIIKSTTSASTASPTAQTSENTTTTLINTTQTTMTAAENTTISVSTTSATTTTVTTKAPCDLKQCDSGTCEVQNGVAKCICKVGYTGDVCENDINECEIEGSCSNHANCTNTPGSYSCVCQTGWTGNGKTCTDINECNATGACSPHATCKNTNGSYNCTCNAGWTGDGKTCLDVDECTSTNNCSKNAFCINMGGTYKCNCDNGWSGDGIACADIDECNSTNVCNRNATCANTDGSYTCACNAGWTGDGKTCSDIDECITKPCHVWANCTNTAGSFTCMCHQGFEMEGTTCVDKNECSSNETNSCDKDNTQECINIASSYFCKCKVGWKGEHCTDEDDLCDVNPKPCSPNANCSYNETGVHCKCNDQYKGNGTICYRRVLIEKYDNTNNVAGDDNILGTYDIPGGIPYNRQTYYRIYVSMNGYISLGQRFDRKYPVTDRLTSDVSFPIIAPLWADIETKGETGGLRVNSSLNAADINQYFYNKLANPRFAFLATWLAAVPYPYEDNKNAEKANFQVVLITNGINTKVMFNYDQEFFTWKVSPGRKVAAGFIDGNRWYTLANDANFTQLKEINNGSNVNGRFETDIQNDDPKLRFDVECYNWLHTVNSTKLSEALREADECPCSQAQAARDRRFKGVGGNRYQSRFPRGTFNSKQTCIYSSNGALMTGIPNGGYLQVDSLTTDDGHKSCCVSSSRQCNQFYQKVPSQDCTGYSPPSWSLTWGDPHLQTIDGQTYTFNGRGEYTLLEYSSGSDKTEIQVRTDFAGVNRTDATVFVALAVKVGDGAILELLLDRSLNSSTLYKNGTSLTTFDGTTNVNISEPDFEVFNDTGSLIFALRTQIFIKVDVSNILDITTSVPMGYKTKGLLGNNDGDNSNDFIASNGTSYPANTSESTIYDFASSWRVTNTSSLFNYTLGDGKVFGYYNNESISKPIFISEINITAYMIDQCGKVLDLTLCKNDTACITDSVVTCDTSIGERTKQSAEHAEIEASLLANVPPTLTTAAEHIIYLGYNVSHTREMNLTTFFSDDNLEAIQLIISNSLTDMYTYRDNFFTLNVSTIPRNVTDPIYIKFVATDSLNASTEYWPSIYYCGCETEQECDYSQVLDNTQNSDRFYVADCNCPGDSLGDFCEKKNCNCYNVTNWDTCHCSCPPGMELVDNGQKCYDEDECDDVDACGQYGICKNTIGSFTCSCPAGFTLNKNNISCDDIDECKNSSICPNQGQYCMNTPGNSTCKCLPGYYENNGGCSKATQSFAGVLVFSVDLSRSTLTIEEFAKSWIETIFSSLSDLTVEVTVTEIPAQRKKRETSNDKKYKVGYILHTSNTNDTIVSENFKEYTDKHKASPNIVVDGIVLNFEPAKSSINSDGICGVPDKTDCDLISTNCVATNGVFTCVCKSGFTPLAVSLKRCEDVNECLNASLCPPPYGNCSNTPGSFDCTCAPGYILSGTTCKDTCQPNPCSNDGECIHGNLEGQFICKCDDKWTGPKCENENSELSKLRIIAIAVGASVGCVCILLLLVMLGMYRRHKMRRFRYSRRPLSTIDDFNNGFSDNGVHIHKDMPIDDSDNLDNGTTFDMPRIPRAKLRDSEYNAIEDKSETGAAERSVSGQNTDENRPLTTTSYKRQSGDSDKLGKSNPSFLHDEEGGQRRSTPRANKNPYEYF